MKKICVYIALIIMIVTGLSAQSFATSCEYNPDSELELNVKGCIESEWSTVVKVSWNAKIEWGFKKMVTNWIDNIALLLWLLSVGSLIYGALSMTLSTWDDEKINKSKDIVKWSLIWFIAVLSAATVVTLVINFMYEIWSRI